MPGLKHLDLYYHLQDIFVMWFLSLYENVYFYVDNGQITFVALLSIPSQ
jgi:hypothetical protein